MDAGQAVTLAIRPEKINLYPQGKVEFTKSGLDQEELAQIFGDQVPTGMIDMKEYLAAEENKVVATGQIEEAIYIGTDTRYRVKLHEDVSLFVRVQNYGSRYDTRFNLGDEVYVHWAAENAQILTE